jgi:hypothetical protein
MLVERRRASRVEAARLATRATRLSGCCWPLCWVASSWLRSHLAPPHGHPMLLSLAPAAAEERAQLRALAAQLAAPHADELRQALGGGDAEGEARRRLPLSSATLLAVHAAGAGCSPPLRLAHLLRGATLAHAPMPVREKVRAAAAHSIAAAADTRTRPVSRPSCSAPLPPSLSRSSGSSTPPC